MMKEEIVLDKSTRPIRYDAKYDDADDEKEEAEEQGDDDDDEDDGGGGSGDCDDDVHQHQNYLEIKPMKLWLIAPIELDKESVTSIRSVYDPRGFVAHPCVGQRIT
ncbi:hypothetical protein DPMN_014150 [Dreissena polymorpha]|uniref:Uncharacterized protein n=1 Tax=Dreissena polymorpha TaxID=45954 RepID=A0A9D4NA80_DREPO|nr:hypothetical protein DPMN_014150 [Dreissena polymorpha]